MKLFFGILVFLLLVACEKTSRNDLSKSDSSIVADSARTDSVLLIENVEYAPSWYLAIPEKEGFIYAIGMAKSRRANIASDKALLNAQVSLAEKLKRQGLNIVNGEGENAIGADSDPDNDNLSIIMKDVMVKNKKQLKVGDIWYSYVLLELKQEK